MVCLAGVLCMLAMMIIRFVQDCITGQEKREEVIAHMAAGLVQAYRYFRAHRQVNASAHKSEPRRNAPKVGAE